MSRVVNLSAVALLLALPAIAATPCNLSMTLSCTSVSAPGQTGGAQTCTAVTMNSGSTTCSGDFINGIFAQVAMGQATISNFHSTLGGGQQCFDSSTLPIITLPFAACIGSASLGAGASFTMTASLAPAGGGPASFPIVGVVLVEDPVTSAELGFAYATNGNSPPIPTCTPIANVPPVTQSGLTYTVSWGDITDPNSSFTVEESTAIDFSTLTETRMVSGHSTTFSHTVTSSKRYFYRVRANSCNGAMPGPNSDFVTIAVQFLPPATGRTADAVVPLGSTTPIIIPIHIDAPVGKNALDVVTYTAATDKPYLSVSPSSGMIPAGGTTVNVTANPSNLPPGANTGTLIVTANGVPASKSVSISLVTPVGPGSKSIPPANALIIPAVAHAPGLKGPFQSDVRLTNTSASSVAYQVTYTPTGTDGTKTSKTTTVTVDAGQTLALNDVVKDFFGVGATDAAGDAGIGPLELRPMNTGSTLNYASSRTFTFNDKGTFGQFIAAIPFSQFATKASVLPPLPGLPAPTTVDPVLSMQQVAQSSKFRTNLGIVEGSGTPANGQIKIYDDGGTLVKATPYSLQPGEHQQTTLSASPYNVSNLADGRIEVTVESATGAVSAYASVIDNLTNDPLAVTPVQVSEISATRYILPGMAALTNPLTNFHSDIRIYNGSKTQQAQVTATFYPQGANTTPIPFGPFSIEPGGVRAFDDVVVDKFNANGQGGSIVLTTNTASSLVATGRTYTIDAQGGTFGQFIPGVSPSQGVGVGERPLQILQLEESTNFRSNLGLVELSGNSAHVRITAYVPDSKTSASTELDLAPNEFRQLGRVLTGFNLGSNVYNARISVEVTSGSGRVASYASVIDNASTDPSYVPAQQ
jgi:hypothetical protein